MQEENKERLLTAVPGAQALDLRRDYHYSRSGTAEGEETHLRDYWRIVRRRWWAPIGAILIVVPFVLAYNLKAPAIYEGMTTIQIDQEDRSVINLKELNINMGDDSQYLNTQLTNLKLPKVAYRVIKELGLDGDPTFTLSRWGLVAFVEPLLGLDGNPTFTLRQAQTLLVTSGESDEEAEMARLEDSIQALLSEVRVERLRETRLVNIRFRNPSPEWAKRVVDKWAEAFKDLTLEDRRRGHDESAKFLDRQIAEVRDKLKKADEDLLKYRRDHQVLDFGEKDNTVHARLGALNQFLLAAEQERRMAELAYEFSRNATDLGTVPEIQSDALVQELKKRASALEQQRAQLLVDFTPEWPEVKKVDEQLAQLDKELRTTYQRILDGIKGKYLAAKQREDNLRQAFRRQQSETMDQNEGAIQANVLQQDVASYRTQLDQLLQKQKEIGIAAASLKSSISITDRAALPRVKVEPDLWKNVFLALFLSLIGGIGLALFLDYINNKIETVEDIDRYLRLPTLGVIPIFPDSRARKLLSKIDRLRVMIAMRIFPVGRAPKLLSGLSTSKELALVGANGQADSFGDSRILTEINPAPPIDESDRQLRVVAESDRQLRVITKRDRQLWMIAESYRQLRTAVLLSSASHPPRTILVTSTQPEEGKTTTSLNLAISLAQTGASVLIVDADMRRPQVHKVFKLKNDTPGLCNFLTGEGKLDTLIQPVPVRVSRVRAREKGRGELDTPIQPVLLTLYVLPAGPPPPDPAQLLGSSKMREMVESLLSQWRGDAGSASAPSSKMREMVKSLPSRFDYVVIDSPPVAAFADSLILSSLVEGVIIVVKGGATPREVAQRTKAHLQSVGANILGVVVNQIKLQPHDYYYYSNYSRYYYQDSDEESESDSKSMAAEAQGSEAAAPQEPSSPKRMNK
jgi:uncharacterized protein involved in exopolysaccharide biosynthesis/Mrp family chromosome partitioning ATPase